MIRSNLCYHSDAYIHVKWTIKILIIGTGAVSHNRNKRVIFKNCAQFTNCISETNKAQVDDAYDSDVVIPMHNLIEYGDNYSKISGILWQYYRDEPDLGNNGNIIDSPNDNNSSISFKFKYQITGQTENDGIKDDKIMVLLKYLSNFWKTLEMLLINYETSLLLTWSKICFLVAGTGTN